MKKTGILNAEIAAVVASMGHGDLLVIGDAGLPIPAGAKRIDLVVEPGVPEFARVLRAVLTELQVEAALVARETEVHNPRTYAEIIGFIGEDRVEQIDHQELKERCGLAKAVIRTGECRPYANIILRAGVTF